MNPPTKTDVIWPRERRQGAERLLAATEQLIFSAAGDGDVNTKELAHTVAQAAQGAQAAQTAEPVLSVGKGREDTSNAERFAEQHEDSVRFWHSRNKWLRWTSTHWADDQEGQVIELAKQTAKRIFVEAAFLPDDEAKEMGKWAERSLRRERLSAMLALAQSDPRIAITAEKLDTDPYLLNVTNGTVDLRNGELREHRREDYLTKLVRYPFAMDLVGPRWLRFMKETFGELAEWVQKAIGYSLTGSTREKAVFLLLGPTDAGKSTFLEVLRTIFSDYSALLQIETLMWSKNEDNNTNADLCDLRGARFAITSETEEGHRLREAKLKRITQGLGTIKATRKYENPITFPETHKLWIDANHAPMIRGVDNAIWNRLLPIPCTHILAEGQKDLTLKDKLLAEAEAIMSWAVAGAVRWHQEGLGRPAAITQRRTEWRSLMDTLGDFLAECCVESQDESVGATELYEAFHAWAERRRHHPLTATAFGLRLADRGFEKGREGGTGRVVYFGLRLLPTSG